MTRDDSREKDSGNPEHGSQQTRNRWIWLLAIAAISFAAAEVLARQEPAVARKTLAIFLFACLARITEAVEVWITVLRRTKGKPASVLAGIMAVTAFLSKCKAARIVDLAPGLRQTASHSGPQVTTAKRG